MKINSLKTRINLLILAITVLVAALVGSLLYGKAAAELEESLGIRLMNLAQISAMLIDPVEHETLGPGDESTDTYIKLRDVLRTARDQYGAVYVYTLRKKDDRTATFVIDTDDDESGSIGEAYEMTEDLIEAFNGKPTFERGFYTDDWGTFKSGYAPITNTSGQVIAVLAVDYAADQVIAVKRELLLRILIPVAVSLILCISCGIWFSRRIVSEISGASNKLKEMSHEVTDNIQNTNEIGRQIAVTFNQLSDGAADQAVNLEKIRAKMQQFVQSINNIRDHARKSSASSDNVVEVADGGKALLRSTGEKIKAISTGMVSLNQMVTALDKDSEKIESIVEVIGGFAEQTKLLAFNAAIEAAGAGKNGRGFAVVASEVSKLAGNSGGAVKEINQLIMGIRNKVLGTVELMEQSKYQVEEGAAAFMQTEGALDQILSYSRKAAELVQQIAGEIEREKDVVQEVSLLIENITEVAQQNAAGSQQVSSSIEEQAANLDVVVESAGELKSISEKLSSMT